MRYRTVEIDGIKIFYREFGHPDAPKLLLLHGFPASSHQYRNLLPALADKFHVIAPDYPGFGYSDMPDPSSYTYSFDNTAQLELLPFRLDHKRRSLRQRGSCDTPLV